MKQFFGLACVAAALTALVVPTLDRGAPDLAPSGTTEAAPAAPLRTEAAETSLRAVRVVYDGLIVSR